MLNHLPENTRSLIGSHLNTQDLVNFSAVFSSNREVALRCLSPRDAFLKDAWEYKIRGRGCRHHSPGNVSSALLYLHHPKLTTPNREASRASFLRLRATLREIIALTPPGEDVLSMSSESVWGRTSMSLYAYFEISPLPPHFGDLRPADFFPSSSPFPLHLYRIEAPFFSDNGPGGLAPPGSRPCDSPVRLGFDTQNWPLLEIFSEEVRESDDHLEDAGHFRRHVQQFVRKGADVSSRWYVRNIVDISQAHIFDAQQRSAAEKRSDAPFVDASMDYLFSLKTWHKERLAGLVTEGFIRLRGWPHRKYKPGDGYALYRLGSPMP